MFLSMLTQHELLAVLQQAAEALKAKTGSKETVFTMPYTAELLQPNVSGWVALGWLHDTGSYDAWDVLWHPETGERRMRRMPKLGW